MNNQELITSGYRLVNFVWLKDADISLCPINGDTPWWKEYPDSSNEIAIDGETLANLLEMMGIETIPRCISGKKGGTFKQYMKDIDTTIFYSRTEVAVCKPQELWAKIEDGTLNLVAIFVDSPAEHSTHAGAFHISWSKANLKEQNEREA